MEPFLLKLSLVVSLTLSLLIHDAESATNETQKLALLDIKSHLTDYHVDAFASWNDSLHFCQWTGVQCGNKHRMVVGLKLTGMNLHGEVSRFIGNLSFLRSLDLSQNSLSGILPPELGHLTRLQNLNLSSNFFSGSIPANLSSCSNLINVSLDRNVLKHQIPPELGSLLFLERLYLNNNHNLSGNFPASFGNLSSLQVIDLSYNIISGTIPETIRNLKKLTYLDVGRNQLSAGMFPPALYNLSKLTHLGLTKSQLHGELRQDIGVLFPHMQELRLSTNSLTGKIPLSLQNVSSLTELELSSNQFTGNIPSDLGNLQHLTYLNLPGNSLGNFGDNDLLFLNSLSNSSSLEHLDFSANNIGGPLPSSIANLSSNMVWLAMFSNSISGSIPNEIAGLTGLTILYLGDNLFTGNIPASIGTLPNLQKLDFYENSLTGEIPSSLGNLSRLLELYMFETSLHGNLPSSFANLTLLQVALFSRNKLNGTIPPPFVGLASLIFLNLSYNSFTGPLPDEVGNLKFLTDLDVSHNNLSGDIPSNLGLCISLNTLSMQNNFFKGNIPDLSKLRGLQYLDLSKNNLTGQVPEYLAMFPDLMNLNLSYNDLEGEVHAEGIFVNASEAQLYGNAKLCGTAQSNLQPCDHAKRHRRHVNLKIIIPVTAVSFCLLLSLLLFFLCRKKTTAGKCSSKASFGRVYPKMSFKDLYNSTDGFSSNNLIGAGSFGTVYAGVVGAGELPIAVKVLNLQRHGASRSFLAECEALKATRHRNLVKLLSVCSAVDYKGNDFKAFIYPFMPNGSLEKWLHAGVDISLRRTLNLSQKINIAIDIASAIRYLHHHCQTPIVHCDLKPSNVLLDSDFTAHVSDFGLARILSKLNGQADLNQFSSLGIKGTIGYTAPEYGLGSPVSIRGDVYSYGVLLLELFTGRSPVDESFKDSLNLQNSVKLALLDVVLEIVDQSTALEEKLKSAHGSESIRELMIDCLVSVLKIGIACTAENPNARINMKQVMQGLVSVKEKFPGMLDENVKSPKNRNVKLDYHHEHEELEK